MGQISHDERINSDDPSIPIGIKEPSSVDPAENFGAVDPLSKRGG